MKRYAALSEILGSRTRAGVLTAMFAEPHTRLHLRELARRAGVGLSSIQRELAHLEDLGLIRSEREGTNRYFSLVTAHPLYPELAALVAKSTSTAGVPDAAATADLTETDSALEPRINPAVRPKLTAITAAFRRNHATRAALFGSAVDPDPAVAPCDLDVLVTFDHLPPEERADAYMALLRELEEIMGIPVDVLVSTAVTNPYLRAEIERTEVVLYGAA